MRHMHATQAHPLHFQLPRKGMVTDIRGGATKDLVEHTVVRVRGDVDKWLCRQAKQITVWGPTTACLETFFGIPLLSNEGISLRLCAESYAVWRALELLSFIASRQ